MGSLNKCMLMGRLGKDVILRQTSSGKDVANFSIAVQHRKDAPVEWWQIVVWEKLARVCQEHIETGDQVLVEGRMVQTSWTDEHGAQRQGVELIAHSVTFMDSPRQRKAVARAEQEEDDMDVPF